MDDYGTIHSRYIINPCYDDLVTFTIGHTNYDENTPILIDTEDPEKHVTLFSARYFVKSLIGSLKEAGVNFTSVVCLHMYNSIMFPLIALAVIGTGAKVTAANPAYTVAELRHHFLVSSTTHVISCDEKAAIAREAFERGSTVKGLVLGTLETIGEFATQGTPQPWMVFSNEDAALVSVAFLNSTSGTTGLAKMAARSHFSVVMEALSIHDTVAKYYPVRRLLCTPFFHGFTLPLSVVVALRFGVPTYVMRRFDQTRFLENIDRYDITESAMPPPMLINFLNMEPEDRKALNRLRKVWSGGAPLRQEMQYKARAMFHPDSCICQVWGMTEGGWMTTFPHPENDKSGSVGRLLATYEAAILVERDGRLEAIREYNTPGEIAIRGPINMIGYHNDPAATDDIIGRNKWLYTGDIGYVDEDGRIFIVERKKDLIKVKGWQVSPAEIEGRLIIHPAIMDAAVIGMDKPSLGTEVPLIFVVLREPLEPHDLKAYLFQTIARYKVDSAEVRVIDAIPKSPSGKILKNELRKMI
ncbi:AMP-binding enzyme-like protein 2 [Elsinoe fawcettii]|nr:AMP-binding enzyme-like protein 2 [Elsinoe fawcettii]